MTMLKEKGIVNEVWLNRNSPKPAKLSLDGTYYSTFDKSLLLNIKRGDHVLITYHIVEGKYNTIDEIVRCKQDAIDITREMTLSGIKTRVKESIHSLKQIVEYIESKE